MTRRAFVSAVVAVVIVACGGGNGDGTTASGDPDRGREVFQQHCVGCHGVEASGTAAGPPLVHEYYVPSHHADESFEVAIRRGVQPHHWDFGPMPAIRGLDEQDIADVTAYVRELQRDAGLID